MAKKSKPRAEMTLTEFASMGGSARAQTLTKEERRAIAKAAAKARWDKAKNFLRT